MDGYTYVNIFETKGIEYIVIIIFLLLLIPFEIILNKRKEVKSELKSMFRLLSEKIKNIPYGLYYSKNHTWVHLEKTGEARMGLDEILMHMTGKVQVNFLKQPGDNLVKGELMAEIRQDGKSLRVFSPVSGKISGINSALIQNPGFLNQDAYNRGWLYSIHPSDWKSETQHFYLAEEAKQWLHNEVERFKDFFAVKAEKYTPEHVHVTLQDGGELAENVLSEMPDEFWSDFQAEFMDPMS